MVRVKILEIEIIMMAIIIIMTMKKNHNNNKKHSVCAYLRQGYRVTDAMKIFTL